MNERRVEEIRKATVNGRKVKMFTVREKQAGSWVHFGKFTAPARTANRDLLRHVEL